MNAKTLTPSWIAAQAATARRAIDWRLYRAKGTIARWRRALAYARGTWTANDAHEIAYESHEVTGCYPLEFFDVDGVLESALCIWDEHPDMERLARRAASRVYSKWSSSGDISYAAHEWAVDLIRDYAAADGIDLVEIDHDWVGSADL